jgi:hypothetical protein
VGGNPSGIGRARKLIFALAISFAWVGIVTTAKEIGSNRATVEIQTGRAGCTVDFDSGVPAETDAEGALSVESVEPGDHYLHINCRDGLARAILISPAAGEVLKLDLRADATPPAPPLEPAEIKQRLLEHIQESIKLRTRGRIEEAARHLRNARQLDPENSDLHRELGITFLLGKDWKRARVEMLEAIRHDPDDADAHNGLAYALEKLGQIEAAVEAYRMATKLDPSDSSYRRHYFNAVGKLAAKRAEQKK